MVGPRSELVLLSPLTPAEVVEVLDALVAEDGPTRPRERGKKVLHGHLRGRGFEIARVGSVWGERAMPIVTGSIEPRDGGSLVHLRFRPAGRALARWVWAAALTIPALAALRGMWTIGVPDPILLFVVACSALGWWVTRRRFAQEVQATVELLAPVGKPVNQ